MEGVGKKKVKYVRGSIGDAVHMDYLAYMIIIVQSLTVVSSDMGLMYVE